MVQHEDDLVCVGHILGAQGIKGWVRVFSNTSPRENVVKYSPWVIEQGEIGQGGKRISVAVDGHMQGKNVIAQLDTIEDRNQAEALTGCRILIDPALLPALQEGEYYWSDLIGLKVESLQGEPLGVVASMLETGADDVMVLSGDRERLIPFVINDIVREVNIDEQRMIVDWLPEY
jgi:16S rRNA processing protein RimM